MKKVLIALVLSFWASLASAQNVNENFDGIAAGTTAETLGLTGVTMSSAPAGGWTVVTFGVGVFALVSGNGLASTVGTEVLTMDFAPGHSAYRFDFAQLAADSVQVTGFRDGVLVFTHTYPGAIPPGIVFPEGTAAAAGIIFDRLVIQSLGGTPTAIDNLAVTGASTIPTLSQWGLVLLAGLMGVGAFATMRRQRQA
jgi:hypothetical protein